jgi:spore cortex formation protein SpoVR/YcgB (stage V sporulation)
MMPPSDKSVSDVERKLDELLEQSLEHSERMLLEHGATPKELETFLRRHHIELLTWKRDLLRIVKGDVH